jgi:hypothetical protein
MYCTLLRGDHIFIMEYKNLSKIKILRKIEIYKRKLLGDRAHTEIPMLFIFIYMSISYSSYLEYSYLIMKYKHLLNIEKMLKTES